MSSSALRTIRTPQATGVASQVVLSTLHAKIRDSTTNASARRITLARKVLNPMTHHLPIERRAAQTERLRGLTQMALMLVDCLQNGFFFQGMEVQRGGRRRALRGGQPAVDLRDALVAHDDRAFDGVA